MSSPSHEVVVEWSYVGEARHRFWIGTINPTGDSITYRAELKADKAFPFRAGHSKVCAFPPPPASIILHRRINATKYFSEKPLVARFPPPKQELTCRSTIYKEEGEQWVSLLQRFRRFPKIAKTLRYPPAETKQRASLISEEGKTRALLMKKFATQRPSLQPKPAPLIAPLIAQSDPPLIAESDPPDDPFGLELPEQISDGRERGEVNDDDEPEELPDLADAVARLSAPPLDLPFRCGNGADIPPVAALKGCHLMQILSLRAPHIPSITMLSLVKSTHQEHRRMLSLLATMPTQLQSLPLPDAILEFLMRKRKIKKWKWSTTIKYLATAQGALSSLPLYRDCKTGIKLTDAQIWKHGLRAAGRKAREELPQQPMAATWSMVQQGLRSESSLPLFVAILLSWMSAARVGCILQLSRGDVSLHPDHTLSIRFCRGKSVLARGSAYTVHTPAVPFEFTNRLKRWLDERKTWLFPRETTGKQVKLSLRKINPALEQRSLRRGSLQALSKAPSMTDELLMLFSGHSSVKTLRRYLNWGTAADHTKRSMIQAAAASLTNAPVAHHAG